MLWLSAEHNLYSSHGYSAVCITQQRVGIFTFQTTFILSSTSGSDGFICKHAALSQPRVYGVLEVFWNKVELKFSVCHLPPVRCPVILEAELLAGRAAVKPWFPWGVPPLLCPLCEITFSISQATLWHGVLLVYFLNRLYNLKAIWPFSWYISYIGPPRTKRIHEQKNAEMLYIPKEVQEQQQSISRKANTLIQFA